MFTPEMKMASFAVAKDSNTKMSYRVMSFLYYTVIRACEIIDWWFPTEYEKLQRKRTKDDQVVPKVEIDPSKGSAISK
jgi:hypothetical protein